MKHLAAARVARGYMLALGAALFLEGGGLLLLDALGDARPPLPIASGDARHNALHVVWGAAILLVLLSSRGAARAPMLALVFGIFYTALAVLGILIDRPFGLLLGPGENVFHWTVGPLALGLGVWSSMRRPEPVASNH
jgi:hypothetical protein